MQHQNAMMLQTLITGMSNMQPPSYSSTLEMSRKKYFEVPLQPIATFLGRDSVLSRIEAHFSNTASNQQLRFAIHGLGGSGKTQIALKYAFDHRPDYDSIFFVNASSIDSLIRDFTKIHQMLQLAAIDNDENKIECVKRWFARTDNTKWLLIFDNADDLEEIDLSYYFPVTNYGNVLITTRDFRVEHPDLATHALPLDVLDLEDAQTLLISRAGIKTPTDADDQNAALIVKELGFLPLAIDQAGAYVQTRRKSLGEYYSMYHAHQASLLGYRSKLSKHEKTVMTTWELSFNRIEEESPEIAEFLLLLCQYDPAGIPDALLKKGCTPQPVFGQDGELMTLAPEKDLVPASMISLLGDDFTFDEAVEKLLSFSLVQRSSDQPSEDSLKQFFLHPLVKFCGMTRASEEAQKKSFEDAICITSHAFPMGNLDGWYVSYCPYVEKLVLTHIFKGIRHSAFRFFLKLSTCADDSRRLESSEWHFQDLPT